MSSLSAHLVAAGNIRPARFCKVSGNRGVAECDAAEKVIGISQVGTDTVPIPELTSQYAAQAGKTLQLHGPGAICLLRIGGSVTAGDTLKSDADGQGVTASSGDESGAIALEGGSSGEDILVQVVLRKA